MKNIPIVGLFELTFFSIIGVTSFVESLKTNPVLFSRKRKVQQHSAEVITIKNGQLTDTIHLIKAKRTECISDLETTLVKVM